MISIRKSYNITAMETTMLSANEDTMARPTNAERERRMNASIQASDQAIKPADITKTPEFQAAVGDAVRQAMEQFAATIASKTHADVAPPSVSDGLGAIFEKMALTFAEISDQGTNRKRVAPEIIQARAAAHARMIERI